MLTRLLFVLALCSGVAAADTPASSDAEKVELAWGIKIPLRDGIHLNATAYTQRGQKAPAPCIFTLTPYIADSYHAPAIYFAAHGFPFLAVDARGRGNSEGEFRPLIQEAHDGSDVVEWLARQPYCNGKVAMWGGSYGGADQWETAKEFPPHLATIVPVAAPFAGVDFPGLQNIFVSYDVQWLTLTAGHTGQEAIYADRAFWVSRFRWMFESGLGFDCLDQLAGYRSPIFQEWLTHPHPDAALDRYNPSAQEFARLALPILTITGSHDGDQPGALTYYRQYMENASSEGRARHYLVIGPWNHAGTRIPQIQFDNLTTGPAGLLDIPKLHLQWYRWTMQGDGKPEFLEKPVAYYVINADRWRYADTLEAVTGQTRALYLDSVANPTDVLAAGSLGADEPHGKPDHYVYDPRDVSTAKLEATISPSNLADQQMIYAMRGKELIYHSPPFQDDTEISGFFRLSAWIAIDQPDTDFSVSVFEIRADGSSSLLTRQRLRARYRESSREPHLIRSNSPLLYEFRDFPFISQEVRRGSRLRVVIAPANSIYVEKNYNSGGDVSTETMADARPVTVTVYHDRTHASALYVPLGQPITKDELEAPASAFSLP